MKLQDIKETADIGSIANYPINSWVQYLKTDGKKWSDAPGARYIVKATHEGVDGYGLLDHEHHFLCISTFQNTIIKGRNFYQLLMIANVSGAKGNFYPMQNLLWTIKEYVGVPIIDYGSQTEQGMKFAKALGKTKRVKMLWFNTETGESQQYNPNEDKKGLYPFRGATPTSWRIVIECEMNPWFPLNESTFDILSHKIPYELFGEEWDKTAEEVYQD